jgi:hypothetical protein
MYLFHSISLYIYMYIRYNGIWDYIVLYTESSITSYYTKYIK